MTKTEDLARQILAAALDAIAAHPEGMHRDHLRALMSEGKSPPTDEQFQRFETFLVRVGVEKRGDLLFNNLQQKG